MEYNNLESDVIRLQTKIEYIQCDLGDIKKKLDKMSDELHNGLIDKKVENAMQRWVGRVILSSIAGAGGTVGLVELVKNILMR